MTKFNVNENEKQKSIFTLVTLSFPVPNPNKSGFNNVIGSSFTTTNLGFSSSSSSESVLDRMYNLNLRKFIIIYIDSDSRRIGSHYLEKTFNNHIKCKLKIMYYTREVFFTLSNLGYLFVNNKKHLYEYIFIFKDMG